MNSNAETWAAFKSAKSLEAPVDEGVFLLDYYNRKGDLVDTILVEISIPRIAWDIREIFDSAKHHGWNSIPGSKTAVFSRIRGFPVAIVPALKGDFSRITR